MRPREGHERQHVVLGLVHEIAELGELGNLPRSWSTTDLHCARAASADSCTNTVPMAALTMRRCVLPACARAFLMKCTLQRCQVAFRTFEAAALMPSCCR